MVFPDLTRFLQKYSSLLANPSVLGYYFHLYIDRKFFKDFIPQVVEFYDKNGQITDIRDEVATVYIQKSQTSIPFSKYLTEEYYYGDYTRMNTYLVNQYKIPLDLNPEVVNPGISEICYKVFPLEKLLLALEEYVEEFLSVPNKYL